LAPRRCWQAGTRPLRAVGSCAGAVLALFALMLPGACSPDDPLPEEFLPGTDQSDCGAITYRNFAADFFARYCLSCHNEQLVGDLARTDAPTGIDFNRLDGIRAFQRRIRLRTGIQGDMPPILLRVPRPSDAERVRLIQWLDCGAPAGPP
jgi:uncharacterized membrane protein